MTGRGWWCLVLFVLMFLVGALRDSTSLSVTGLALLLWFAWEWLFFTLRLRTLWSRLRIERQVQDDRGPIGTLWQGRSYRIHAELQLQGQGRFPFVRVSDPVPFGTQHVQGATSCDGELRADSPLAVDYRVSCPLPGAARFEGLRVELSDLHGFFAHVGFVRSPVVYPILPVALIGKTTLPTRKRTNQLMPPGIHHHRQPGSGSELLDLRDYLPGDPPRTIAWKVSARRDRLVTKEFESEVPIRCILFLDVSSSVRVPSAVTLTTEEEETTLYVRPLDRLIELAAGVLRCNAQLRDLTGLCLFDESSSRVVRPARGANHQLSLLQLLGEASTLAPITSRADVEPLLPIAYSLAQEIYPELLRPEINRMPTWLTWLVGFPRYSRHNRGLLDALSRSKRSWLLWGTMVLPLALLAVNVLAILFDLPDQVKSFLGGMFFYGVPVLVTVSWLVFLFSLLVSAKQRKHSIWRKRLAALFARQAQLPMPAGLDRLLEDDDLFSLYLQRFLADHQVPCPVPLYDEQARYLFALPQKIAVLAQALVSAVARGRDNELYVLLADLLELDAHLEPLLQAIRVALGRHHQVLLVCAWPENVPLPDEDAPQRLPQDSLPELLASLTQERLHDAYRRIRRSLARLGVRVLAASNEESLSLVLDRIERLRSARPTVPGASL